MLLCFYANLQTSVNIKKYFLYSFDFLSYIVTFKMFSVTKSPSRRKTTGADVKICQKIIDLP